VQWNASTLALHLIGHTMGLKHDRRPGNVMSPFAFDPGRRSLPGFSPTQLARLEQAGRRFPEPEYRGRWLLPMLLFHVVSAFKHMGKILRALLENRAPLLPLRFPSLATAAAAPTLLLVFTAEIWDVGLGMTNTTAALFASGSILAATAHLATVQDLLLPRKEKRIITEHLAVVNVLILMTLLAAIVGLFLMLMLLMLLVEFYIFPSGLISTWPTLDRTEPVTAWDKLRLAAFISTIGVLTGALAGGLESRALIRHLALFLKAP